MKLGPAYKLSEMGSRLDIYTVSRTQFQEHMSWKGFFSPEITMVLLKKVGGLPVSQ